MECQGFALTEDSKGEIRGGQGLVALVVLADKHSLIISVAGDIVGEKDATVDCSIGNFGQLLVAARYGQDDRRIINRSIWSTD